jgi:hypothetical protein
VREVAVQLWSPPPLDTPLPLVAGDGGEVQLRHGNEVVAVAGSAGDPGWAEVEPVDLEVARGLEPSYAGLRSHPFPTCFSCGPERAPGDGLRIFPGRLDQARVAASWVPAAGVVQDGVAGRPVTWAALDCVSAWSSDLENRPMVLGRMVARVRSAPEQGTPYVVVGLHRRTEGRKTWTASAMFTEAGRLVAQAEHLWISVDVETLRRLQA